MNIKINRYISDKKQELLDIIDKESRILLVANPGTGKTYFATKLMELHKKAGNRFIYATFLTAIPKQLNSEFNFDLVCSSYEKKWTDRLSSAQPGDDLLESGELVIGTTLHQLLRFTDNLSVDDVIVIDEAHQLVQLAHQNQIYKLREELLKTKAKLLLMTGTPFEHEEERLKLTVVNVEEKVPRKDKLIYVPITKSLQGKTNLLDLTAFFIQWHLDQDDNANEKKVLVYNNSSKVGNEGLSETVEQIAGYKFDNINADQKESEGYEYLMEHQCIRNEVHGIITTSVIKEGINIKNQEIELIIVLGQLSEKDEKQIVKRVRVDKPLKIIRIFNEPDEDRIDEVEFEIDLVNLLVQSYKTQPKRLKKLLQRLANCGEILKSTGILDDNVEQINEVKAQDVIEQLNAYKCTLDDYLKRQSFNDLEAVDGNKYLKDEYELFLVDENDVGEFTDKLKIETEKARNAKEELLKTILIVLFGNSMYFDKAIKLMKCDMIGYSTGGKLLQEIDTTTITNISAEDYKNSMFEEEPLSDMDDEEIKELMEKAVKAFAAKYRDEMEASIRILLFLTEHSTEYEDVLPIFNDKIDPLKLEWHAKRFKLSEKLDWIKSKLSPKAKKGSLLERAAINDPVDHIRIRVMREIESHIKKYSVVHFGVLTEYISKRHGANQYMQELQLQKKEEVKLFVYAMGIATENVSWKRSDKNKKHFDSLWKETGHSKKPVNGNSIRVHNLEQCGPTELIDYYRDKM